VPTDRGSVVEGSLKHTLLRMVRAFCFKLDYLHREGLQGPAAYLDPLFRPLERMGVLGLHKYLPYRSWFRGPLASFAQHAVSDLQSNALPYWNIDTLRTMADEHVAGKHNRLRELHLALTLGAIDRTLLRSSGPSAI